MYHHNACNGEMSLLNAALAPHCVHCDGTPPLGLCSDIFKCAWAIGEVDHNSKVQRGSILKMFYFFLMKSQMQPLNASSAPCMVALSHNGCVLLVHYYKSKLRSLKALNKV